MYVLYSENRTLNLEVWKLNLRKLLSGHDFKVKKLDLTRIMHCGLEILTPM